MRRTRTILALACVSVAAAACANILGIDDGIPREVDASVDASTIDVALDVVATDAKSDASDAKISPLSCGTTTCNFAANQACCRTGSTTYTCIDAGSACTGTYIPCDRPAQCVGGDAGPRECCTTDVLTDAGYVASSVACMLTAQCAPIPSHYILCGDNSNAECPDATLCTQSVTTLPTFLICK